MALGFPHYWVKKMSFQNITWPENPWYLGASGPHKTSKQTLIDLPQDQSPTWPTRNWLSTPWIRSPSCAWRLPFAAYITIIVVLTMLKASFCWLNFVPLFLVKMLNPNILRLNQKKRCITLSVGLYISTVLFGDWYTFNIIAWVPIWRFPKIGVALFLII